VAKPRCLRIWHSSQAMSRQDPLFRVSVSSQVCTPGCSRMTYFRWWLSFVLMPTRNRFMSCGVFFMSFIHFRSSGPFSFISR